MTRIISFGSEQCSGANDQGPVKLELGLRSEGNQFHGINVTNYIWRCYLTGKNGSFFNFSKMNSDTHSKCKVGDEILRSFNGIA